MADTLSIDLQARMTWLFQEALDLSTVSDSSTLEYKKSLADGTAPSQADKLWHASRVLAAGANDDLDLTSLATTVFGGALTLSMAKVKGLLLINTATTAGEDLVIGNGPNAFLGPLGAAAHTVRCEADSCLLLVNRVDGWTVTAGSGDILRINNAGSASNTYHIALLGTSV